MQHRWTEAETRAERIDCQLSKVGWRVDGIDPDGSGTDLIAELRELCPGSAALMISANLDPASLARVREAGAEEVLDKFAGPAEVIGAIRRLGNG